VFLDTCFLVDLLKERKRRERGPATQTLETLGETELLLSVFVLCELRAGAELSGDPQRELPQVTRLVESHPVIYPDSSFPTLYGEAAGWLLRQGTPIPVMDLMIGVIAKRFGAPILTRDTEHFKKIPGLVVLNY
jgi:predicted nucleic acid-binding protein